MRPMEGVGRVVGAAMSPLAGTVSLVRRARTFHPEGAVYCADVFPLGAPGGGEAVAERLRGPALVRMSSAWWRGGKEWTDILGCAVRFRSSEAVSHVPEDGDQDLLFATIRSPWTMLLATTTTQTHDFLANDYYAVSPFRVDGLGKVKWRLVSPGPTHARGDRGERMEEAVRSGRAVLHLEARALGLGKRWFPIAELRLTQRAPIDQAALRFSPFRAGRGIHPIGFIHALRHATYALSQSARPKRQATA